MTAKEYLNRPFKLNSRINDKKVQVEYYRNLSQSISSPSLEPHYASSRNTEAPFIHYLEKVDALEREIQDDYKRLNQLKSEVENAIDDLNELQEKVLLHYRYVAFMSMPDIAYTMHYSLRWTKRLHVKALEIFERSHPQATPKPPLVPGEM